MGWWDVARPQIVAISFFSVDENGGCFNVFFKSTTTI